MKKGCGGITGEEVASLTGENCHYGQSPFYEKVVKVKVDLAAHLAFLVLCGLRRISAENFALGSLRSDDWQLGRPAALPVLSVFRVFSPPNASFPCCIDPGSDLRGSQERPEGAPGKPQIRDSSDLNFGRDRRH
jgi:hypothetical protein